MPYTTSSELPPAIRRVLPPHAQDIYREAFNHAHERYGSEDAARRVAWAAVKRKYEKLNGVWQPREAQPW